MDISPVVWWIAAGIVLAAADVFLGTFYLIVMGLACGAAAVGAWADLTLGWQLTFFAVAAIVGGLIVRKVRVKDESISEQVQHPDVGQTVTVTKWSAEGTAQVMYRGASWTAQAIPGAALTPGLWRIVEVNGARLVIAPIS